jgi:hypothetical protein
MAFFDNFSLGSNAGVAVATAAALSPFGFISSGIKSNQESRKAGRRTKRALGTSASTTSSLFGFQIQMHSCFLAFLIQVGLLE